MKVNSAIKSLSLTLSGLLLATACSNKLSLSSSESAQSFTFKSLGDATATSFTSNEEFSAAVKENVNSGEALLSHLDTQVVMFGSLSGKSVLFNTATGAVSNVTAAGPVEAVKKAWTIAIGNGEYWSVGDGKIFYKGTSGSEGAVAQDTLQNVLDDPNGSIRPVSVSKTDLIGLSGNRLVWLKTQPNLGRELYLNLDSSSLANNSPDKISGGGVIKGRGVWLQVADYVVYVLKDSAGQYSPESYRLRNLKAPQGVITPERFSAFFESDEKGVIAPRGTLVAVSGGKVYQRGGSTTVVKKDEPQTQAPPPSQERATSQPSTPTLKYTLDQLQTMYTSKFKSLIDTRCQGCHSARASNMKDFASTKTYASQAASYVSSGEMPKGGSLSATEKADFLDFLDVLKKYP